jgi:hypothetical protein
MADGFIEGGNEALHQLRKLLGFVLIEMFEHAIEHGATLFHRHAMAITPRRGESHIGDSAVLMTASALGQSGAGEALNRSGRSGGIHSKSAGEISHSPGILLGQQIHGVEFTRFESSGSRTENDLSHGGHRRATAQFAPRE